MVTSSRSTNTVIHDTLFDSKIDIASEGLSSRYCNYFYKIPLKENALTLASYVISMKLEINPSNNYRMDVIEKIGETAYMINCMTA
jgi:hypothetical protein